MNKTSLTSAFYRLMPAILLSLFVLSGCAGTSKETRYDENTKTYSNPQNGVKSTTGRYENTTAHYTAGKDERSKTYSNPQGGVKSTVGQYDDATAQYTLKQGGSSMPQSEAIKDKTVRQSKTTESVKTMPTSEEQAASLPMTLEVTDVLFEFGKWVIKEPFVPELDRWVEYFQSNPSVTAEFYGHTDSTGPTAYNQKLSENRARAVVNYLVGKGVNPDRLTTRGFGESQPAALNNTKEGRQKNRRVEVKF